MAIPTYEELMLPILKIAANGEASVPTVEGRIADEFNLERLERAQLLPSGRQSVLSNRMHWAKYYLMRAGLLAFPARGRFTITDAGRELLARKPSSIDGELLEEYPLFREFQDSSGSGKSAPDKLRDKPAKLRQTDATPEEQIDAAYLAMQSALRTELLERILQNSPNFFEQVIVELLVGMGYGGSHKNAAEQLGGSGDGGVDGVINEDRLGLDRVYVQAKRYALETGVGRPDIQAFVGSLVGLNATKGVFVATSYFSAQAVDFARHLQQRVILIDGKQLADLLIEHNVGVRINRTIEFKRVDEDFFGEEE